MNNSSNIMFSLDIASGPLPSSINVCVSYGNLEKGIYASWKISAPNLLNISISLNSSIPFFFTSTVKALFTSARINLSTDDGERNRALESTD